MWLRKLFKNLLEKNDDVLFSGTVGFCFTMNNLNNLVGFVFVVFDVIFKFPDWFHVSSWAKLTNFNFKSFLFIYLIHKLIVSIIAIFSDIERMNVFFFIFFQIQLRTTFITINFRLFTTINEFSIWISDFFNTSKCSSSIFFTNTCGHFLFFFTAQLIIIKSNLTFVDCFKWS